MTPSNEEAIHRAVVDHLRWRAHEDVVWWHTPNGEARHRATAGRLKAMGVLPGVPDLLLLRHGRLLGLELKSERGRLSPAQRHVQGRLVAAGALVATAHGVDAALATLDHWGILKRGI